MADPVLLRHRAKVRLVPAEGRGDAGRQPLVVVKLTDGTTLGEEVAAVLGTVDNPMTRDQVIAKSRSLMSPILGAAATSQVIDAVLTLEDRNDVRTLRPLLQKA
jgi:2-methylcitrate dehydratase PrpD